MPEPHPLRVMSIMAHQDDFEFNAGGSFAALRQTLGEGVELRIVATSRGATGHHEMTPDATFARRDAEARQSAALIGATYECLTQLDGSHVPGQVLIDRNLLGGLWNTIRAFEPDVIFCPPVTADPLAGIHVDHENTAIAVRMLAYQIGVPNAYPTVGGPRKQRVAVPLIINVDDTYACEPAFHIRQDVSAYYETKCRMGLCHASQVFEWLPFTAGRTEPIGADEWRASFRERHLATNRRYGQADEVMSEYFRVTRWGRAPREGELDRLFPHRMADA